MKTRRRFLQSLALLPLAATGCKAWLKEKSGIWVNDIHSRLNRTRVAQLHRPGTQQRLIHIIKGASESGQALSICGGRHAMGGQQFGTGTTLVDINRLNRILYLDTERGLVEVESGIQWPELIDQLHRRQESHPQPWIIAQKQTGADRLTLAGALAANIHSRGLTMKPIISDVESFNLLLASGETKRCSRSENPELFRLAIGGYGLFGVIRSIQLRLVRRRKLRRQVELTSLDSLMQRFDQAITRGATYGDFQFSIDPKDSGFLYQGILSLYEPVSLDTPMPTTRRQLDAKTWNQLLTLAHTDKTRAFQLYADFYQRTDGQLYWSDEHQMNSYSDDYHLRIDRQTGAQHPGSEMISELYVPRKRLPEFMARAAADFRANQVDVIYGTIRLIEKDRESFLAWATEDYACVIFNLHVTHTKEGIRHTAEAFRRLIDLAISLGGSYYLTYHRWATREQVLACYPQFREFMERKLAYDPNELFQSDWYRHHKKLIGL